MSAAAERRFEEKMKRVEAQDKKDFVVGAKVYRAGYDKVEEGEVVNVFPCRINSRGDPVEDPSGPHTAYCARFGVGLSGFELQTYHWKFFIKASVARAKLVYEMRCRVEDTQRSLVLLNEKIEALTKEGIEVLPDDRI
jgi:hypothetical protein